jgi:hypothetical protein
MLFIPRSDANCKPDLLDAYAFVDTLALYCDHPWLLPDGLIDRIKAEYGRKRCWVHWWKVEPNNNQRCLIFLQQPAVHTLTLLNHLRLFKVSSVDVAIDFIDAPDLSPHIVQRYHRKNHGYNQNENTTYLKLNKRAARNGRMYSDRLSKTHEGKCFHLELRFRGADACRRAGLGSIHTLITGPDVMALLENQVWFMIMDEAKFDRMLNRQVRTAVMSRNTKQTAKEIKSRLGTFLRRFSLQEFHDCCPKHRHCLRSVPWPLVTSQPKWHTFERPHIADNGWLLRNLIPNVDGTPPKNLIISETQQRGFPVYQV